jgi:putative FmdB family regulatory protein
MPIYEYGCHDCRRRTSLLVRGSAEPDLICQHCGGTRLTRLISSFAFHKSMQSKLDEAGPPQAFGDESYYKNPANIGRWAKHRAEQAGIDLGEGFDAMVERAKSGADPSSLIGSLVPTGDD